MYAREKKKWIGGFEEGDEECARMKGRRGEWWDVVDEMEVDDLLEEIKQFKKSGRGLAVEPEFADGEGDDEEEAVAGGEMEVTGVAFQGDHCSMDAEEIVAYTELIAGLTHLAYEYNGPQQLQQWLEAFRGTAHASPGQPLHGFEKLLSSLHISDASKSFFQNQLQSLYHHTSPVEINPHSRLNTTKPLTLLMDPFYPIRQHVIATLAK